MYKERSKFQEIDDVYHAGVDIFIKRGANTKRLMMFYHAGVDILSLIHI